MMGNNMPTVEQINDSPELQVELSKRLREWIEPDGCWHERYDLSKLGPHDRLGWRCKKCNFYMANKRVSYNPNYFTDPGFLTVLRWARGQEWWGQAVREWFSRCNAIMFVVTIDTIFDSPHLQLAVLEFLEKGEK